MDMGRRYNLDSQVLLVAVAVAIVDVVAADTVLDWRNHSSEGHHLKDNRMAWAWALAWTFHHKVGLGREDNGLELDRFGQEPLVEP